MTSTLVASCNIFRWRPYSDLIATLLENTGRTRAEVGLYQSISKRERGMPKTMTYVLTYYTMI